MQHLLLLILHRYIYETYLALASKRTHRHIYPQAISQSGHCKAKEAVNKKSRLTWSTLTSQLNDTSMLVRSILKAEMSWPLGVEHVLRLAQRWKIRRPAYWESVLFDEDSLFVVTTMIISFLLVSAIMAGTHPFIRAICLPPARSQLSSALLSCTPVSSNTVVSCLPLHIEVTFVGE